jgi:hypothetical protein
MMLSTQFFAWCGVGFAGLAALLWAGSAAVNIPLIGSGYGAIAGLDEFYAATRKIARLNMFAAISAAISALCQALSLAM